MLSDLTGNAIYLKLENLQMTGSFKERGALNRILTMTDDEKRRGVIAASAGTTGRGSPIMPPGALFRPKSGCLAQRPWSS